MAGINSDYSTLEKNEAEAAPYYRQNIFMLTPLAIFYYSLSKCGTAPAADDHGPRFPNENSKYASVIKTTTDCDTCVHLLPFSTSTEKTTSQLTFWSTTTHPRHTVRHIDHNRTS